MKQPTLFDRDEAPRPVVTAAAPPDQKARDFAVDPLNHVVLEASAGTGKTRVLVDRYVRLIEVDVDPRNILAITFTRKAAAEMRERVLTELRRRAALGAIAPERWRRLFERVSDIEISTIDAFCFSLLREFPLEANVDPAFEVVDETEVARFVNEALDLTFRAAAGLMDDEAVRLLFARVKLPVLRDAMASLVDRRHVAVPAVARFLERGERTTAVGLAGAFIDRLRGALDSRALSAAVLDDGPRSVPEFDRLAGELAHLDDPVWLDPARVQHLRRRLERYFLTKGGEPRKRLSKPFTADRFTSREAKSRHERALGEFSLVVVDALARLDAGINRLLGRGLFRLLVIAVKEYERLLEDRALLDFAGMLDRAVALVANQEEFARSRLKLQSRYHHVLVDEVQDTSRKQWQLISLLVDAWGEGEGVADAPTSIFVVGDRKQSIYRFRHAEVTLLEELADRIGALRTGRAVRQAITTSFRAVPELLAFVNAVADGFQGDPELPERFVYRDIDRFPIGEIAAGAKRDGVPVLGVVAQPSMARAAAAVADEIVRLLDSAVVRDRQGGPRAAKPDDIAILFRARAGHQYYEEALELRGVPTYVYKGLGFFDAPEVQDLHALLRYLADPSSDLRAAELLRSRFVRVSDAGLARLAPKLAESLASVSFDPAAAGLDDLDRRILTRARASTATWRQLADRIRPSELLDAILKDTAYASEMRGRRFSQARENVKKVRSLVRRVENRGYATLDRLASYFATLRAGDESNAIVEASGAVNLMTMHAAKGLEFPIVFLVNLHAAGHGRPAGFSVIERGHDGEPQVAFGPTEDTELEERRELEELRRLFYVATTRARDRLYLSAEVDDTGSLRRGARSLASLMPPALAAIFPRAAGAGDGAEVEWPAGTTTFAFRVCGLAGLTRRETAPVVASAAPRVAPVALETAAPRVLAATAVAAAIAPATPSTGAAAVQRISRSERALGVAIHRLFQRRVAPDLSDDELVAAAMRAVDRDEEQEPSDSDSTAREAARLYRAFRARPDVEALLSAGDCLYEVPFSFAPPDRPTDQIRGVIDCLVVRADGHVTVVEFKTGLERPEHAAQAALYRAAVRSALPDATDVDVRILYS